MSNIESMKDLCDYFCAEEPAGLTRRIYKDTACGASISVCVRNPHNTRPDRIEMVVKPSTYQKAKYPYAKPTVECWVNDDENPWEGHIVSVTRKGDRVDDPDELAAYTRAYNLDNAAFFWGSVEFVPHEKVELAGDGKRHGWLVTIKPHHDPLLIELPSLVIESLLVGDRRIPSYLGDHLREAYRDCQWFEQWEKEVWQGLFFSCGADRMEFWPQDSKEARRDEPVTLETLKAKATRFIEYGGRTKLVWELQHPETPESIVVSVLVRRHGEGSKIVAIDCGDDDWIPDPKSHPQAWLNAHINEVWFDRVVSFFSLDTGLDDVPLERLRSQEWGDKDEVQVDPDPDDPDEIQITKIFRASDKCWGWKTHEASEWVWVHNGNSLWRELTLETPTRAFTIQSIVEGSDATVDSDQFTIPCDTEEIDKWMEYMEEETSAIWERDNHDWYYVRRGDDPVGQAKTGGFDEPKFESWSESALSEKEQRVLLRWLGRGGPTHEDRGFISHTYEPVRVACTNLWVEKFDPEVF